MSVPRSLQDEHVYQFHDSYGYDGQFYHYIAHDPLMRNGMGRYIDSPRLRYTRILVPAVAFLLAGGQSQFIDVAYRLTILLFVFLGAYWSSRFAVVCGRCPLWGLAFALVPSVIVSIDRYTVDIALASFSVAYALYAVEERPWHLYVVLLLAGLTRETGVCLITAYVLYEGCRRQFWRALTFSTTVAPFLGWSLYIDARTPPHGIGVLYVPFSGIVSRLLHPISYPVGPSLNALVLAFDYLSLAGILLAIGISIRLVWKRRLDPISLACFVFAGLAVMMGHPGIWTEPYGFGRTFSPLLLLLALHGYLFGDWRRAIPLLMVGPAIGIRMGRQVLGVMQGLL